MSRRPVMASISCIMVSRPRLCTSAALAPVCRRGQKPALPEAQWVLQGQHNIDQRRCSLEPLDYGRRHRKDTGTSVMTDNTVINEVRARNLLTRKTVADTYAAQPSCKCRLILAANALTPASLSFFTVQQKNFRQILRCYCKPWRITPH